MFFSVSRYFKAPGRLAELLESVTQELQLPALYRKELPTISRALLIGVDQHTPVYMPKNGPLPVLVTDAIHRHLDKAIIPEMILISDPALKAQRIPHGEDVS